MTGYKALALTVIVNGIIALVITLLSGLQLHEVLAGYAFVAAMVNHVNNNTIIEAIKTIVEFK